MQMITCDTHKDFMNVVYDLVRSGLTFTADHSKLTITLLGGY